MGQHSPQVAVVTTTSTPGKYVYLPHVPIVSFFPTLFVLPMGIDCSPGTMSSLFALPLQPQASLPSVEIASQTWGAVGAMGVGMGN